MREGIRRDGRRGSALVTVVLVILILTIVGLGVAYFAQMEEGLSGNARATRAAFYAAEVGLRKGESVISTIAGGFISMSTILTCGGCSSPINLPGSGWPAVILKATDPEGGATKEFLNMAIPMPAGVFDQGTYSLYVRNNPEDPGGQTTDTDRIVLLVSVGQVRGASGRVYTKILEEQLLTSVPGAPAFSQYLSNAGGTSSGVSGN
ncbi:MAG TPA: PilX N-terminal domain-containing pilus assembly protein [Thermoanaerobaculia bacterium]|nr:PilX N-terminal domain-containing pilus assembly protein [Thermoanaerobaculia bacterium]HQR66961.1 PilX N-terminal domain-containing pilus assembly protein [Thermoanaerobaculia bacterium]